MLGHLRKSIAMACGPSDQPFDKASLMSVRKIVEKFENLSRNTNSTMGSGVSFKRGEGAEMSNIIQLSDSLESLSEFESDESVVTWEPSEQYKAHELFWNVCVKKMAMDTWELNYLVKQMYENLLIQQSCAIEFAKQLARDGEMSEEGGALATAALKSISLKENGALALKDLIRITKRFVRRSKKYTFY